MKSTLCRTYFKCIRRDLDSTFALGLNGLDQSGKEMLSLLLHETDDYYFDFVYKNLRSSIFLENSTLAEKPLETSQKFLAPTKSPIYHCGTHCGSIFQDGYCIQASLLGQQDKETLLEVRLYASGCSKFKESEIRVLSFAQ